MNPRSPTASVARQAIPLWRDVRVLRITSQVVFVVILVLVVSALYATLTQNMARRGLLGGWEFLGVAAGFHIGESVIEYSPSSSYGRAFLVGVLNTLQITAVGIALATLVGVWAGVARLSTNWLVSKLASTYIEIVRNVPLLVQLVFWYFALILQFPPVQESIQFPGPLYLSRRGVALPWPSPSPSFGPWLVSLGLGMLAAVGLWWGAHYLGRAGRSGFRFLWAAGALLAIPTLGWVLAPQPPVELSVPELRGFNFRGGVALTPEFSALLLGLVLYTGAFIAEVVRGGILSVKRGQIEAARALGLNAFQVLRLVVFPQALRVIVPPLTSQYLNLAKNSSLATIIGYSDLFNVGTTVANQTGRPVQVIILIMGSYLTISLITSLLMNIYNRRVRILEK